MPKYRFKDNKIKFSDIMDIFQEFEDTYGGIISEMIFDENHQETFVENLHSAIINCNENVEMANVEMYDEEKNGAIVFSIRSKYNCLRTIANTKIYIMELYCKHCFNTYSEMKLYKLACMYLEALEYFFTYSYMVRDEVKQKLNSKFGYFDTDMAYNTFKQYPKIPYDGEDTGV